MTRLQDELRRIADYFVTPGSNRPASDAVMLVKAAAAIDAYEKGERDLLAARDEWEQRYTGLLGEAKKLNHAALDAEDKLAEASKERDAYQKTLFRALGAASALLEMGPESEEYQDAAMWLNGLIEEMGGGVEP